MSTGRTMHITAAGSDLDDFDALNYPARDIAEGVKMVKMVKMVHITR